MGLTKPNMKTDKKKYTTTAYSSPKAIASRKIPKGINKESRYNKIFGYVPKIV